MAKKNGFEFRMCQCSGRTSYSLVTASLGIASLLSGTSQAVPQRYQLVNQDTIAHIAPVVDNNPFQYGAVEVYCLEANHRCFFASIMTSQVIQKRPKSPIILVKEEKITQLCENYSHALSLCCGISKKIFDSIAWDFEQKVAIYDDTDFDKFESESILDQFTEEERDMMGRILCILGTRQLKEKYFTLLEMRTQSIENENSNFDKKWLEFTSNKDVHEVVRKLKATMEWIIRYRQPKDSTYDPNQWFSLVEGCPDEIRKGEYGVLPGLRWIVGVADDPLDGGMFGDRYMLCIFDDNVSEVNRGRRNVMALHQYGILFREEGRRKVVLSIVSYDPHDPSKERHMKALCKNNVRWVVYKSQNAMIGSAPIQMTVDTWSQPTSIELSAEEANLLDIIQLQAQRGTQGVPGNEKMTILPIMENVEEVESMKSTQELLGEWQLAYQGLQNELETIKRELEMQTVENARLQSEIEKLKKSDH